jgi:hypothetical protein
MLDPDEDEDPVIPKRPIPKVGVPCRDIDMGAPLEVKCGRDSSGLSILTEMETVLYTTCRLTFPRRSGLRHIYMVNITILRPFTLHAGFRNLNGTISVTFTTHLAKNVDHGTHNQSDQL